MIRKYLIRPVAWILCCPLACCLTYIAYRQKGLGHQEAMDQVRECWQFFADTK